MIYHQGPRIQRGRGLGSIFSALARGFAPIARLGLRAGKNFMASPLGKKLGQSAIEMAKQSAVNIGSDILAGNNVKKSAQKELQEAKKKIASTLRGGRKRKINTEGSQKKKPKKLKTVKAKKIKKQKKQKKVNYSLLD